MASGHVERLKSGRFRVAVYAGKDPITGRKVYLKETHATEDQAIKARDRLLVQVEAGSHPDRAATVAVLMERWMEVVDHELSTAETTAGYVRRTINPALGEWTLRKLQYRVDLLDRLYKHLGRCNVLCDGRPFLKHKTSKTHDCTAAKCAPHVCKPMAPARIRRIHAILSSALNYAISWGWVEKNPAAYAHPPKLSRRRARPQTPDKVAELLNAAAERDVELGVFLWVAVTTGARRGEVTALRWPAVGFEARVLVLSENYVVRAGQRRLKGTKTDTDRTLSLDPETVQILRDFQAARRAVLAPIGLELPEDAFVFSPVPLCDRPWHPDHFTHAYREVADSLGIPEPLKNLRHFNATQLLAAGVDLRTTAGLSLATPAGRAVIGRRLYLSTDWAGDDERRTLAGVPDGVAFATKPDLAVELLQTALAGGVRAQYVTADEVYGSVAFRTACRTLDLAYVVAIPTVRQVTTPRPPPPHQVRTWTAWHRWSTPALSAYAFLVIAALHEHRAATDDPTELVPLSCPELQHLLIGAVLRIPCRDRAHIQRWSHWRRHHQAIARGCHRAWNAYPDRAA